MRQLHVTWAVIGVSITAVLGPWRCVKTGDGAASRPAPEIGDTKGIVQGSWYFKADLEIHAWRQNRDLTAFGPGPIGSTQGMKSRFPFYDNTSDSSNITGHWVNVGERKYTIRPSATIMTPFAAKRIVATVKVTNIRLSTVEVWSKNDRGTSDDNPTLMIKGGDQGAQKEIGRQTLTAKNYVLTVTETGMGVMSLTVDLAIEIVAYDRTEAGT